MNVVSFFAGCGGLDLGFEQAGFHVVWANEFNPHCRATYERNHPNTEFVLGDICKIDPNSIPDCDGFIGGPPCQSWSVAGKQKGLDDNRGQLFLKYIELINAKKPKFFVIENVKGLLDDKFKDVFEDFVNRLENAGYDVQWTLLDAVNYRIPQNRERVFMIGFRKELYIKYMFPTWTSKEPITLNQAIGDLAMIEPKEYSKNDLLLTNLRANHDVLKSGYGPYYMRGNRRRGWSQPSFTIHATADNIPLHPSSPKMIYFGHETWKFQQERIKSYRRLSVRECARIQTFPDNFIFEGTDIMAQYKMIGNAVPPRLGNEIAKSILRALAHTQCPQIKPQENIDMNACVLVGYYKDTTHKQHILQNRIYYVRSDGRPGSVFKQDCTIAPKYLLLHHKEDATIFKLEYEEPVLADGSYLKTLGFNLSGRIYLVFRLKSEQPIGGVILKYNSHNYAPYFSKIEDVIVKVNN